MAIITGVVIDHLWPGRPSLEHVPCEKSRCGIRPESLHCAAVKFIF